jgi:hypothetical protein
MDIKMRNSASGALYATIVISHLLLQAAIESVAWSAPNSQSGEYRVALAVLAGSTITRAVIVETPL